jgi:hypothetical protein
VTWAIIFILADIFKILKNVFSTQPSKYYPQLDITENSLFFGKKSMQFKSGDPLDIFTRELEEL